MAKTFFSLKSPPRDSDGKDILETIVEIEINNKLRLK
jgi:hypothetical protein